MRTNKQKDKSQIWNTQNKVKRLQLHGSGKCVMIPKSWIEHLEWTIETPLIMRLDSYNNRFVVESASADITIKPRNEYEDTDQSTSELD